MGDSNRGNGLGKVILGLFFIGLVLFVIGFATDFWTKDALGHGGLWKYCLLGKICTGGSIGDVLGVLNDDNLSRFTEISSIHLKTKLVLNPQ